MENEPIILRDIAYEQAKKEITDYVSKNKGKEIYITKLMKELKIGYETTLDILDEMRIEGVRM